MVDLCRTFIKQTRDIVHNFNVKRIPEESISLDNVQSILLKIFEEIFGQHSGKQSFVSLDFFVLFLSEFLYFFSL